jgi:hypothetical protein
MEWTADDTNSFSRIHAGLPKGHGRSHRGGNFANAWKPIGTPASDGPMNNSKWCGWRIVISTATGHVTLLHLVAGLGRFALVVADFKGIRNG